MLREQIPEKFCQLEEHFSQSPAGLQVHFQLAGRRVCLASHDPDLGRTLLRPLGHLLYPADPDVGVDLKIELLSQTLQEQPDSVFFDFSPDRHYALQILPRSYSLWRRQPAKIVAAYQATDSLSLYELGRPLHAMLSLWLNQEGAPLVHAGLVEVHGQGILVGGQAGAGKTTTCLACLEAGQGFLGDDLVALDANFCGHSLYATTFLPPPRRQACTFLGPEQLDPRYPWEEKSLTYLWPSRQAQLRPSAPVSAVVLPGPSGPAGKLAPAQALLRLAPSSLLVGALTAGQSGLDQLASLVTRVPCYRLPWGEGVCARLEQMVLPKP